MPLQPAELDKLGMGQFPLVIGGVVPAVNIYGVDAGEMRFTGRLLADIFLGNIIRRPPWAFTAREANMSGCM